MKAILIILSTLVLNQAFGQPEQFKVILDSAKTLFKGERSLNQEELDKFDYNIIVSLLERAVALEPKNAEARYFLGYAYARINSRDGRSMIGMNLNLVIKSCEQLKLVNKLSPLYTGELVILDPYSKITAEWGSMAMSYWHNTKPDSAIWAFKQGKKYGGFGKFILELNRKALDACTRNAILISSGDNFTIPLWYLQIVEGYRKDISVIDISLLNSSWYPSFVNKKKLAGFDLPDAMVDTIEYTKWVDSMVTIKNFSWIVKPSYDQYLLRGDRLFLSLLKQNGFKREVFFTVGFDKDARLSLGDHLKSLIIVDALIIKEMETETFEVYKGSIQKFLKLSKYLNLNSPDERVFFDYIRYNLFWRVRDLLDNNEKKKATELMDLLDKYGHERKFQYNNDKGKEYAEYLRKELKQLK